MDTFQLCSKISDSTAQRWLNYTIKKGWHDRDDVVAYRNKFIEQLVELDKRSLKYDGVMPILEERPLFTMKAYIIPTATKHSFGGMMKHVF